jgi:[protein-PII] uridylyltransferase
MFTTTTRINIDSDRNHRRTILELVAADRPGLLHIVGRTFVEMGIDIETAKILTIGERAEDVFYIVREDGKKITDEFCDALRRTLLSRIDDNA